MNKKYNIEKVREIFKVERCELLEDKYINTRTKMRYECSCGNISEITFDNFKQGHRCKKCGVKKIAEKQKLTFVFVKKYFEEQGCELLEKEYINNQTKMKYRCACGNVLKIKFSHFQDGCRCKKCGAEKIKFSFEFVKKYFENNSCKLLESEYINCDTKMKYSCDCGNISKISFSSFKQGHRCKKCGLEKISGKNNYNYNYNLTDEERDANKSRLSDASYKKWRKDIYIKDKYTCQKCSQVGIYLNAHHILNYSTNKELRLDISNGITLCLDCHKKFHKIYGKVCNNKIQLGEFLKVSILCLK